MNSRKLISLLLCLALAFGCMLPLTACKKYDDPEGSNPGGTIVGGNGGNTEYTVKVQTVGKMPLADVTVYIHNGEGFSICAMQQTDENGIARFTLKTSNDYSVQIGDVPDGYNVREGLTKDDRDPLMPDTVITLSSAPIATGGFASSYELGDVMYDFTITDITGTSYKLSDILKTKDMVMLNFWYRDCTYCAQEFPYINAVYEDYKDDIEILAINDYPSDTLAMVEGYTEYLKEDLKMPLFKLENNSDNLIRSKFPLEGYPTTVIIDRYGVVTMIEVGAVLGESKWKNIFDHFVGEDYNQSLISDPSVLNPMIEPTVKWNDEIANQVSSAFTDGGTPVTFHPETNEKDAKYAWPFITTTYNGETVVVPSNTGIDNSFAILYAEVSLKPGQAITFDYFASTQNNSNGTDVLYVLVDGKDIYSIAGISEGDYKTCCTYVDPRPVTPTNKDDAKTYTVAFAYYKDDVSADGDDTVYLKNLKVIDAEDIDVETYIFRYAATDLNDTHDGYNTYVEVFYNAEDGYYHVGSVDGPLLLANHLGYTQFDSEKTISERVYVNYELMVGNENMFKYWVIYGNAASNSHMPGYTPVTEELKTMLIAYCNKYRLEVGKAASENLWLQLCVYFDAYGTVDGKPTPELANPIQGLTAFSAIEMDIDNPNPTEKGDIVTRAEVEYSQVIMPRGYLFKFVPTKSGVYRVTSKSDQEVVGWIFTGTNDEWAENGDRTVLTHYDVGERHCVELLVDTNNDGIYERDMKNVSLVAYMEAGKEYFIDIAYYDIYATGKFTFDVTWVGETFNYFIQASSGPITYIESLDGSMGDLIALGIDFDFKMEGDKEYAYHVLERDKDGNVTKWGEKIYADFYYPTTLFPTQSIEALIKANAFNYMISELDREALIILDGIRVDGRDAIINKWINDKTVADEDAGKIKWEALGLDAALKDLIDDDTFSGTYSNEVKAIANEAYAEGKYALLAEWGAELITTAAWSKYNMDKVIRGEFSENEGTREIQEDLLSDVLDEYDEKWAEYQLEDVRVGTFHNTDNRTGRDKQAQKCLEIYETQGKDKLKSYWDAEFDSIVPPEEDNVTDVSEWRFQYFWEYYQMDDVKAGKFHGDLVNNTDKMIAYLALMDNGSIDPQRQGCVAVDRDLAKILDTLVSREVFENVQNGWLKFCYYYDMLGVVSAD